MDPTESGKSPTDLANHFPIEIINTNSIQTQVYQGVLPHLLGTISSNVEVTAKKLGIFLFLLLKELKSVSIFL
ncbi:Uncharacterized protein TCM_041312 [Theobroma cacao]|uniref:Uncharacterized protein n=1 Tax=Theobroma cacao TaxID=3641 RepID=A0A061GU22_THECC|nr:Uncharacterized protein TCM_041312 [Theobroma cacao]